MPEETNVAPEIVEETSPVEEVPAAVTEEVVEAAPVAETEVLPANE